MQVETFRLAPFIAQEAPGAPYYALMRTLKGTQSFHRNHDFAEIMVVTGGEGRLVTFGDGEEPRVEVLLPGEIYLHRPIDIHQLAGAGPQGVSLINIAFPVMPWQAFMRLAGLDPRLMTSVQPPVVRFDPADPSTFGAHERAFRRFWEGPTMLDLIEFWVAMAERFAPPGDSIAKGAPKWFLDAIEEMRTERNLRGGMQRFVELCHVSAAHLWRTAVRYSGMTPTELLGQLRIRQGAVLLGTTTESVASIAERVGFASGSSFSKAFHRANLVSPRGYRKSVLAGPTVASGPAGAALHGSATPRAASPAPAQAPPHPGEIVAGYLAELELDPDDFADHLDVSASTVRSLLDGSERITAEIALRLSVVLGRNPENWLAVQDAHDLWTARRDLDPDRLRPLNIVWT